MYSYPFHNIKAFGGRLLTLWRVTTSSHAHTHMAGTRALPLFQCLLGFDDDKAKHNDPKMDERQTFKLLTALA